MTWFHPIFVIKIVSAILQIFRKNEAKKKAIFSFTITILDHTLYGKVKNEGFFFGQHPLIENQPPATDI